MLLEEFLIPMNISQRELADAIHVPYQRVNELTERALEVYSEIFENPSVDYKMKKETADTIVMDIAGHRAPTKVQSQNMNVTANMDQINAFKERGLKAARESGLLVTIEDKEVVNE